MSVALRDVHVSADEVVMSSGLMRLVLISSMEQGAFI